MKQLEGTRRASARRRLELALTATAALVLSACTGDDGSSGERGPSGPPGGGQTDSELDRDQDAPGINLNILSIKGGSGPGGSFQVGDQVTVRFTAKKDSGADWNIAEWSRARILVSGPTFNYQRVLAEQSDVATRAARNSDGSYTYTFAQKIPSKYLAPYNDTPSFGPGDGELTGQALVAGTYTVGLYGTWDYTVEGAPFRNAGDATADFLLGNAGALQPRAVVGQENCNRCHDTLQAHGGMRRDVTLCLLCHTSGAEDRNTAGATPGASVDFRVMIHKIHSGAHLPSVNGVATLPDGTRNYASPRVPYQLVGFGDNVHDYSAVEFPAWPGGLFPTPRDFDHSSLGPTEQALEDVMRTGVTDCAVCHGDPDGPAGPVEAPDQGDLIYSQLTRRACGSCHDDIDWTQDYRTNFQTMPPQLDDVSCAQCHPDTGGQLAALDGHVHPLLDPAVDPGLNFSILGLREAGTNDGDGTIDPGERVELAFTLVDDAGLDVDPPSEVDSLSVVISGPTDNYNLVLNGSIPPAALTGPQPFTINVPERIQLEDVGSSTAGLDVFPTARAPHWVVGAATEVRVRTATAGGSSTLAEDAEAPQNYLDLVDATGFDRDDYVAIGAPGTEEYLRIQWVDGDRLWFSSPYSTGYAPSIRVDHASGTPVEEVTLSALTEGVDYSVDAALGEVTELVEFGAGNDVLVTYTTDFEMPATYPVELNGSPDLDDEWGSWTGLSVADGTYTLGLWGYRSIDYLLWGETNSYRGTGAAAEEDFLVGSATVVDPYALIDDAASCDSCHQDLWFHGGSRRGFTSCILCHGTAGSEDRPQYVAANAPPTDEVTVNFRTMLHKIHMGEELDQADSYTVVGYGPASAYPDNFSLHTYEDVVFPTLPDGPKHCTQCHGAGNDAWKEPAERSHPTDGGEFTRSWRAVCGACHDSDAATTHIDDQTSPAGIETCVVCHGEGRDLNVELMHKVRR